MSTPEAYNPNLPENINVRNEAHEINGMVDKNFLTRQEAGEFDYAEEMEIPEALLSAPPKISKRLWQKVMDKFPPESFDPENIAGRIIHGTYIGAIKSIWLGKGEIRTSFGGKDDGLHESCSGKPKEGLFEVVGDTTVLDNQGFCREGKDSLSGQKVRSSAFANKQFPLFLLFGKISSYNGYVDEQRVFPDNDPDYDWYFGGDGSDLPIPNKDISSVVITKDSRNLKNIRGYKNSQEAEFCVNGRPRKKGLVLSIRQETNYIAHCMVQGVDKSKIVPIYDWDGNLLWPTEDDVIKKEK